MILTNNIAALDVKKETNYLNALNNPMLFKKLQKYLLSFLLLLFYSIVYCQNNGLVLNGSTDFLEIDHHNVLNPQDGFTIECWINANCEEGNNIIASKNWCYGNELGYYLSVNNGKLFWNSSSSGVCQFTNILESNNQIPIRALCHIAVVHSQSKTQMYLNGELITSKYIAGYHESIHNSNEPLRIGTYRGIAGGYGNFFSGLIDNFRIWNKALTVNEINQSKNTLKLTGTEQNLVLNLEMQDQGIGQNMIQINRSPFGSILNGKAYGYSTNSPYTTLTSDYGASNFGNIEDVNYIGCENEELIFTLPNENYKEILWSDGSNSISNNYTETGVYSVTYETELCNIHSKSFVVKKIEKTADPILNHDTILCNQKQFTFTLPETFVWDHNQSQTLVTETSGTFPYHHYAFCDTIESQLNVAIDSIPKQIEDKYFICGNTITLDGGHPDLSWTNGLTGSKIIVDESGFYGYFLANACGEFYDEAEINIQNVIQLPNVFSPYVDRNKTFPGVTIDVPYILTVFDNWGNLVYEGNSEWDGTLNGSKVLEEGVYFYKMNSEICSEFFPIVGTITLLK